MLKTLLHKLQLLAQNQPQLDLAKFNDPLALTIEWPPGTRGGANFRTLRLVETDFSRVEFKVVMPLRVYN